MFVPLRGVLYGSWSEGQHPDERRGIKPRPVNAELLNSLPRSGELYAISRYGKILHAFCDANISVASILHTIRHIRNVRYLLRVRGGRQVELTLYKFPAECYQLHHVAEILKAAASEKKNRDAAEEAERLRLREVARREIELLAGEEAKATGD